MIIKLNTTQDFIDFYEKHTKDATVFYFDNTNFNTGFMICDTKYTITYDCIKYEERNYIIDYLNSNHINYVIAYNERLPESDYNFTTITIV